MLSDPVVAASPEAKSNIAQTARSTKIVDWSKMSRGLGALVQEAQQTGNGETAYFAARGVAECQTLSVRLSVLERAIQGQKDESVRKQLVNEYEASGRVRAQCQSLQGEPESLRLQLLTLAAGKIVPGATAELISLTGGRPNEGQWKSIAADAEKGDLLSLAQIISAGRSVSGIGEAQYAGYKLALRNMSSDVELKRTGVATVDLVELLRVTAPYGEIKSGVSVAHGEAGAAVDEKYFKDPVVVAMASRIVANIRRASGSLSTTS
jgi:hypothetical protein